MSWRDFLSEHKVWNLTEHVLREMQDLVRAGTIPSGNLTESRLREMLGNFLGARNDLDPSVNYTVLNRVASQIENVRTYFSNGERFWLESASEIGGPVDELADTLRTVPIEAPWF